MMPIADRETGLSVHNEKPRLMKPDADMVYAARHVTLLRSTRLARSRPASALHDTNWQCDRCGVSMTAKGKANVHHRKALRTTMALAVEPMNLQCLCRRCHTAIHNEMKYNRVKGGCDPSGYPLSKDHPWYQKQQWGRLRKAPASKLQGVQR
jgi:5-methylcytosine-specific restriction endonuclease McrA